jgi:hypothetical protein
LFWPHIWWLPEFKEFKETLILMSVAYTLRWLPVYITLIQSSSMLMGFVVQDVLGRVRFVRLLELGRRLTATADNGGGGLKLLARTEQGVWSALDVETNQVPFITSTLAEQNEPHT